MKLWNNVQLFNELSIEFYKLEWMDIPCIVLVEEYYEENGKLGRFPYTRVITLDRLSDLKQEISSPIVRQIKALVLLENKIEDECDVKNFKRLGRTTGIYIDENIHSSLFNSISDKYDYFRASWFQSFESDSD